MKRVSLSVKMVLVIVVGVIVVVTGLSVFVWESQHRVMNEVMESRVEAAQAAAHGLFEEQSRQALAAAVALANTSEIRDVAEQQDRDEAIEQLMPAFDALKEEIELSVLHLRAPADTSLVRAQALERFGDRTDRRAILDTAESGEARTGFQEGAYGLGMRGWAPVFADGEVVGTLEANIAFTDTLLYDIRGDVGAELVLYTPDPESERGYSRVADSALVLVDPTAEEFRRAEAEEMGMRVEDQTAYTLFPLFDYDGEPLAMVGIFTNVEFYEALIAAATGRTVALVAALGLLLVVIVYLLLRRLVIRPINAVAGYLKQIAEEGGDLTRRIDYRSGDEIGALVYWFNSFAERIRGLIVEVKNQAGVLSGVGTELATNMEQTASAVHQIGASVRSVSDQTENQAASVNETSATMEQMVGSLDSLNDRISRQATDVSESSSSIEEMLASINSVTQTLVKNSESIDQLSSAAEEGREELSSVTDKVQSVAKESEGLVEISSVIQDIAGQTDLLSMNAAIEAAHAGEAGKGFAVVADEIRRLAETSGEEARKASSVLQSIKEALDEVTHATEHVLARFESMESDVKSVAGQESSIRNAMEEQNSGSKQIFEAVKELNDITTEVRDSAEEMRTGGKEILEETGNLRQMTEEIRSAMNEMAGGAEQITTAVQTVDELGKRNQESIRSLLRELEQFKTGDGAAGAGEGNAGS